MPVYSCHNDTATYFSPYERPADVIVAAVNNARHSIRMADYGFTLRVLAQALVAARARGVDVYCILDHTQAHGRAEEQDLAILDAGGVAWVEGTSETHHAIMHQKTLIVDAETVISGSYNFSEGAAAECNTCSITPGKTYAAGFLANWYLMFAYIATEEAAMQQEQKGGHIIAPATAAALEQAVASDPDPDTALPVVSATLPDPTPLQSAA